MSQTFNIKLENFKELNALLSSIPEDIAKRAGVAALRKGAKSVLEEAKMLVPVRTGKLRDSLEIATKKVGGNLAVVKVQASRKKGGFHAHLVELGTSPHKIQDAVIGNKHYDVIEHPGSQKQPFLRPALLNKKEEVIKTVFENIGSEVTKQFKREMKK